MTTNRIRRDNRNRRVAHRGGQLFMFLYALLLGWLAIGQPRWSGVAILGGLALLMLWLAITDPPPPGISAKTLTAIRVRTRERMRRDWPEHAKILDEHYPIEEPKS